MLIDWYKVGWVRDAHGIRGEIYVKLMTQNPEWLKDFKVFYLEPKSTELRSQKFTVKKSRPHKQGLIISTDSIRTRNDSGLWKGSEFLIPKDLLVSTDGDKPFLVEVEGFQVIDSRLGEIGKIKGFAETGAHEILLIDYKGKEVMIPFVDAFVEEIDRTGKTLKMDLPEGLLGEDLS